MNKFYIYLLRLIGFSILSTTIMIFTFNNLIWAQENETNASKSDLSPGTKATKPFLKPTFLRPIQPLRRAMVIVVEENEAQSTSVSWGGLSRAMQQISPQSLLPNYIRNSVQSIANVVDPMIRTVNIPGVSALSDVVNNEMRKIFSRMLANWILASANQLGIPGNSPARSIINTLGTQGPAILKDPFSVFKDRIGETGLGNCLYQMASPYYNHVEFLTDSAATFPAFSQKLKKLHNEGYLIDILLDVHGCGAPVTMNNDNCGSTRLVFANSQASPQDIQNINGGRKLNLNTVYMVSCWGSNFTGAWQNLGAKAVNGPYQLNYFVLLSPIIYMDQFTRAGKSIAESANNAYNIERTLLNGTFQTVLDLRPFLNRWFPPRYAGLKPCIGLTYQNVTVGYHRVNDYSGNVDYCVIDQNIPALPRATVMNCPVGYSKVVRPGYDTCKAPDPIALACGGSRDRCVWTFDIGPLYSGLVNSALGRIYGANSNQPVNNALSSQRRQGGDGNTRRY